MKILKLKAGALHLTTGITVVIALLLFSFILYVHLHNTLKTNKQLLVESIKNSQYGVQYLLNVSSTSRDTIYLPSNNIHHSELYLHKSVWGVFEKISVSSKIKNKTINKIALVGAKPKERPSLYLKDNGKPLVVVGQAKISGLTYLPKQGVRTGNISGQSYYGDRLIYGNTKQSYKLPKLNRELKQRIENNSTLLWHCKRASFKPSFHQAIINSFKTPTLLLENSNEMSIYKQSISGNIIVKSDRKIVVDATSKLQDVILIAPEIVIKKGFKGHLQAFASRSILVEEDVVLEYPSALVLNLTTPEKNNSVKSDMIYLSNNSHVKGLVICLSKRSQDVSPKLVIQPNSLVSGDIYSTTNIQLEGTVNGSIYTDGFAIKHSGSIYQNHILNGKINAGNLNEHFNGLLLDQSEKDIAKWLY